MKKYRFVYFCSFTASLGGLLFGFDSAVISGAEKTIQQLFNLDGFWHGFTVAIALIGTLAGALIAGKPADIFGRKKGGISREYLFKPMYRTPIILAIATACFNQLTGINAIMYYAPRIFEMIGYAHTPLVLFEGGCSEIQKDYTRWD